MILADKISTLRKQNAWSQEEMADKLGVSRQAVSKWESGASIPDLDRLLKISALFGVSTDYLLKDEMETDAPVKVDAPESDGTRVVTLEDANAFMDLTRGQAPRMALGVLLCVLSPICLLQLGGVATYFPARMTEGAAVGVGLAALFLLAAAGAALLILGGMRLSPYEYLERDDISLQYGVRGVVESRKRAYEATHRACVVSGVVTCVLGVVPLVLSFALGGGDFASVCCLNVLLVFAAGGAYLFVRTSLVYGSFQKLLQEADYAPDAKAVNKRTAFFPGAYWCLVTAGYLAAGFLTNRWDRTWIIWPVAGVLFAAIYATLNAAMRNRK